MVSLRKFIQYDPHSQHRRRGLRIGQDEWAMHRSVLERLWILGKRTVDEVKNVMADKHSFSAS